MPKRMKTKKEKNLKDVTKRNLKMIMIIIIMIIIINNNDYNDSNRKGKALKVATKKTLKYRNYFLPDF